MKIVINILSIIMYYLTITTSYLYLPSNLKKTLRTLSIFPSATLVLIQSLFHPCISHYLCL